MPKKLISYILSVVLSILYMYYLDEESGLIITAMLLIAPLISLALTLINAKTTRIYRKVSSEIISNGEYIDFEVIAKRSIPFPAPMLNIEIKVPVNFTSLSDKIEYSPEFSKKSIRKIRFYSRFATCGDFYIEKAYFYDFLGIFKFKNEFEKEKISVAVVPKITLLSHDNAIFTSFSENISYDDEIDTNSDVMSVNTTPGYEHREYIPSDPIKRINWKLSSKLNKLMVRLDEYISASKPIFVIDLNANDDIERINGIDDKNEQTLLLEAVYAKASRLLENVLGTLRLFVTQQIECRIFLSSMEQAIDCASEEDIQKLAIEISKISILQASEKSNIDAAFTNLDDETNIVYCTFARNANAALLLQHCKNAQSNAAIITAQITNENFADIPTYYYDENNILKKCKGK